MVTEQEQENPNPQTSCALTTVLSTLYPRGLPVTLSGSIDALVTILQQNPGVDWSDFLRWNRTHKPGALVFRTAEQLIKGHAYALNDYAQHDPRERKLCRAAAKNQPRGYGKVPSCCGCRKADADPKYGSESLCKACYPRYGKYRDAQPCDICGFWCGSVDHFCICPKCDKDACDCTCPKIATAAQAAARGVVERGFEPDLAAELAAREAAELATVGKGFDVEEA